MRVGELEELLDRVRKEVGSDANIVAANRIRKGGIGGFFAREGFEVLVDVSDESRLPKQPQPKAASSAIGTRSRGRDECD